jgi:hypothetical protein
VADSTCHDFDEDLAALRLRDVDVFVDERLFGLFEDHGFALFWDGRHDAGVGSLNRNRSLPFGKLR